MNSPCTVKIPPTSRVERDMASVQCMACGKFISKPLKLDGAMDRGYGPSDVCITCCPNGSCLAEALGVKPVPPTWHYGWPKKALDRIPPEPGPGFIAREVYAMYYRHSYSVTWCVAQIHSICVARKRATFLDEVKKLYRLIKENKS